MQETNASVLLLDNHDSFTENIAAALRRFGPRVTVLDAQVFAQRRQTILERLRGVDLLVIGPGPRGPADVPWLRDTILAARGQCPIFGICLGMQAMLQTAGADVYRASAPCHGKVTPIEHDGSGIFDRLVSPMNVMRYHSLVVNQSEEYKVAARCPNGQIMAVADPASAAYGVQFHPESIGTEGGLTVFENIFRLTGVSHHKVAYRDGGIPPQRRPSVSGE